MKIGVSGTSSVGKTTLITELVKLPQFQHYHVFGSPTRMLKTKYDIDFHTGNSDIQLAVLALQLFRINQYEDVFFDRTMVDHISYYFYYKRHLNSNLTRQGEYFFLDMAHRFMACIDVSFISLPEFPNVPDGVRTDDEEQRTEIVDIMDKVLKEYTKKFCFLSGSIDNRVKQVVSYINDM